MAGLGTFKIQGVQIDGIGKAASVNISPSIIGLVTGKIVVYSIVAVKPEFAYTNPAPQQPAEGTPAPAAAQPAKIKSKPPSLIFHHLRIVDGVLVYSDLAVSPETGGIKITVTDLDVTVTNTYQFPKEIVTKFALSADIPWKDSPEKGSVKLDGWMNYDRKDMRAMLEMKDIDALYLYPYYSGWFSLDKANIQKAKLAFISNVTGLNNDVTAACHLELTELSFKQREADAEQSRSERIAQKVLQFFQAMNNGKVNLDFSIRTKMDSPEFGLNSIKNAFYNMLNQARREQGSAAAKVMEVPGQVVGGTVKGVSDVSSALIGGVMSVGRELGRSLKASFRRESPVSETSQGSAPAEPVQPEPARDAGVAAEQVPAPADPQGGEPPSAEPPANEMANK
jgi:hypothetical protein